MRFRYKYNVIFITCFSIFNIICPRTIYSETHQQTKDFTPADNKFSPAKAYLGKLIFFDKRLSADGTISCAVCHNPDKGFTDGRRIAIGVFNREGSRNAPTLFNVGEQSLLFHDGRAELLEGQSILPLQNIREFGDIHINDTINTLHSKKGYRELFTKAFPEQREISSNTISKSIAAFERTLISKNSIAQLYFENKPWFAPFPAKETRPRIEAGLKIMSRVGCFECHPPPNFRITDGFANTGIAQRFGERELGRFITTDRDEDRRKIKIPTLIEIQDTAPYGHAGEFNTLEEVLDHYESSAPFISNTDNRLKEFELSEKEFDDVIYTLKNAFKGSKKTKITIPKPDEFPN